MTEPQKDDLSEQILSHLLVQDGPIEVCVYVPLRLPLPGQSGEANVLLVPGRAPVSAGEPGAVGGEQGAGESVGRVPALVLVGALEGKRILTGLSG